MGNMQRGRPFLFSISGFGVGGDYYVSGFGLARSVTASPLASAKVACGTPKDSAGAGVGFAAAVFIVMAQAKAHPPVVAP